MKKIGWWIVAAIVVIAIWRSFSDDPTSVGATANRPSASTVDVQITSDPSGARVTVAGRYVGTTPVTVPVVPDSPTSYSVEAPEPYDDYNLYKKYGGTINASEPTAISVWLERTSATEQAAQRQEAEARREAAAREACERRLASVSLIIESWSWSRSYDYAIAEGRVTNRTNKTLENIMAVVEFETSDGTFITSDDALLDYQVLLPGQSTPFKVYARYNPAMARARLTFREFWGGQVGAARRQDLSC